MSILGKFKSLMEGRGGRSSGRLDVENRYEMLRDSISGTMSKFRMARDRQTGEVVGLKILDSEKTEYFEARFKGLNKPSEGEIAVQFDHPNVVKTLEFGETTDGRPYVLMEFVPGKGLNSMIIARDPALEGKRLNLMRQMAEAIKYVHDSGYIHRDICPRNFICSDDATRLTLIDFGLTLPAKREFMLPGNRTGTPQYMSPEIARRRATDQRVDIFSLGVTFYQLLTFELPWPSGDMTGKVALLHDTKEPDDIRTFAPHLDERLTKLIHSCIAAQPQQRPADMDSVVRSLNQVPDGTV